MPEEEPHNYMPATSTTPPKPTPLPVKVENIPQELKDIPRWVLWRLEIKEDKNGKKSWSKVPKTSTGKNASVDNPSTWTSFNQAIEAYQNGEFDGVGVVMVKDQDNLIGLDFDHIVEDDDVKDPKIQGYIDKLNSYTEISPSGTGIRIFGFGELPLHGRKNGPIEVYDSGHYLTVTGQKIGDTKLRSFKQDLLKFHKEVFGERKTDKVLKKNLPKTRIATFATDEEMVEKILTSQQSDKFNALYNGDDLDYPSTSEADLAFMNILAFWTGKDAERMDRIYKSSSRYRAKWDEKRGPLTYGQMTVNEAINSTTEIYCPSEGNEFIEFDPDSGAPKGVRIDKLGAAVLEHANIYLVKELARDKGVAVYDETSGKFKIDGEDGRPSWRLDKLAKDLLGPYNKFWTTSVRSNFWTWITPELEEISISEFDTHRDLMLVGNGVINLRTKELLDFDPEYMLSKGSTLEYKEDAKAPKWTNFLKEITCNNEPLQDYLSHVAGYWTTGEVKREECYVLFGLSRAGKTKFVEGILLALEDLGTTLPEKTVTETRYGNSQDYELATLRGIRLVKTAEVSETARLKVALVKTITGDAEIPARPIASRPVILKNYMKLVVIGNYEIDLGTQDRSIRSRIKVVPFELDLPDEKIDRDLLEKFKKEKEGILKWLVDCSYKFYNEDISTCNKVEAATDEYFKTVDPLRGFCHECLDLAGPKDEGLSAEQMMPVYQKYFDKIKGSNDFPLGSRKFESSIKGFLGAKGFRQSTNPREDKKGRWYPGVKFSEYGEELQKEEDLDGWGS